MPHPITSETLAQLQAELADEKRLIAACIESKSTAITSLLPFFFLQFLEIFDTLGQMRYWIDKRLPGGHVLEDCETRVVAPIKKFFSDYPNIEDPLSAVCRGSQKPVTHELIPAMAQHTQDADIQTSMQSLQILVKNMPKELSLNPPSYGGCLKVLRFIALTHNPIQQNFVLTFRSQINQIIAVLRPIVNLVLTPVPQDPLLQLAWICDSVVNITTDMNKSMKHKEPVWGDVLDRECNNEWKESAALRATAFMILQVGVTLTCRAIINRSLVRGLNIPQSNIPPIDGIMTEEAAKDALRILEENKSQLEIIAKKSKNSMYWFSLLTLPLLVYFFLGPEIFQTTILTFMLSTLSFTGRESFDRFSAYRQKNQWYKHRDQLKEQLKIALQGLNIKYTTHYEDNPDACYILLVLENNKALTITREQQRQVLVRVLHRYKIDTTRMGGHYKFAISGQTILANALAINQTLTQEITRQQLLVKLEEQLTRLASLINLQIAPIDDTNGLPSFRCSMLAAECPPNIEALFPQNKFSKEENGKILIMEGFNPGNEASLKKILSQLQAEDSALKERFDASVNTGNTTLTPLRQRQRLRPSQAPIEPVPPLQAPEERIVILWNSGKRFDSVEAKELDYRQAGAVIPVASDFFPANRYFCIFEISPHEVNNDVIYGKFLEQAQYPRTARLQGEQGILFWNETRSFNKFTYDFRGQLARRERVDYIAAAKLKIKGDGGDARCYGWAEVAPTGETLLHFIEYDPETH